MAQLCPTACQIKKKDVSTAQLLEATCSQGHLRVINPREGGIVL